jgi:rhamnose transport system permease protein
MLQPNPEPRYAVADRAAIRALDVLLRWETILVLLLAAVIAINAWSSPFFLDVFNLSDATSQFSEKAIIALGMALLILVRDIDLSVAAIVALAALAIGSLAAAGHGPLVLLAASLAVGVACGAFNGLLVTVAGLPSIVVTIGTMSLYRGLAQVILGDQALTSYPPEFTGLGQGYIILDPPLYLSFLTFLGLAVVFGVFLHATATGRRLFAMGANPVASRFSGVPVDRLRFALFVVSGLLCGLAAFLLTSRLGSMRSNIAIGWELDIVTMVILGGVSIAGGVGSIPGVVLAVFVIGLVTFGMSLNNVPGVVISVFMGGLLIVSLAVPIIIRRLSGKRA